MQSVVRPRLGLIHDGEGTHECQTERERAAAGVRHRVADPRRCGACGSHDTATSEHLTDSRPDRSALHDGAQVERRITDEIHETGGSYCRHVGLVEGVPPVQDHQTARPSPDAGEPGNGMIHGDLGVLEGVSRRQDHDIDTISRRHA